jgi:hypothetical protein
MVDLYYIRGFKDGEFDEAIPKKYFQIPSSECFEAADGDGQALRVS